MAGPDSPPPPPGPGRDNLLSVNAVAARLDVGRMTVYRMCYAGLLTAVPVGLGKSRPRIRIPESEVNELIRAGVR